MARIARGLAARRKGRVQRRGAGERLGILAPRNLQFCICAQNAKEENILAPPGVPGKIGDTRLTNVAMYSHNAARNRSTSHNDSYNSLPRSCRHRINSHASIGAATAEEYSRPGHNLHLFDGGENYDCGGGGNSIIMPSIDAIAETQTLTSNYGAEYGLSSAGSISSVLKSRTKTILPMPQ